MLALMGNIMAADTLMLEHKIIGVKNTGSVLVLQNQLDKW